MARKDTYTAVVEGPSTWDRFAAFCFRHRWTLVPVWTTMSMPLVALVGWILTRTGHTGWLIGAGIVAALMTLAWGAKGFARATDRTYLAIVAGLIFAWEITAIVIGPWTGWLLGVWLLAWPVLATPYWKHQRVRQRVRADREIEGWPAVAEAAGIAHARLRSIEWTQVGKILRLRLAPGQTAKEINTHKLESAGDFPPGSVRILRDKKNARHVDVHIVTESPWDDLGEVAHPLVEALPHLEMAELASLEAAEHGKAIPDPYEALPATVREWIPGSRSIIDALPIGVRVDLLTAALRVYAKDEGGRLTLIGGKKGAGKTNLINVLMASLAACNNVVIWAVDIAKSGRAFSNWLPCIDWLATDLKTTAALLRAHKNVITARAAAAAKTQSDTDKALPTKKLPFLIVIIDEASSAFAVAAGDTDDIYLASEATQHMTDSARTCRSEAAGAILATQRPDVSSIGNSGTLRAQIDNNIGMRMRQASDGRFIFPDDYDSLDTSLLELPGLLYLKDGEADPLPVRAWALYDPPTIRRIAAVLAPGMARLDAVSVGAAGEVYARRPTNPLDPNQNATTPATQKKGTSMTKTLIPGQPTPTTAADHDGTPAANTDPARVALHTQASTLATRLAELRAQAEAQLANPPGGVLPTIALDTLAANHQGAEIVEPGDDDATRQILALLATATERGMAKKDLLEAIDGVSSSTITRRLAAMERASLVHGDGKGSATRWHHGPATDATTGPADPAANRPATDPREVDGE